MKFIQIHIPKTGGTSVSVALGGPEKPDHRTAWVIKQNSKDWDSYFKFIFVRNTWDWVVSDFFARNRNKLNSVFKENKAKFKEYVMGIRRWDSQRSFFIDPDGEVIVDFIGKFENLYFDFDHICFKLGIDNKLNHLNSSEHWHYTLYYDDESRERVADFFKEDIKFLGYKYDRRPTWTEENS